MSAIEWTEKTWNPVTGCDLISPGCANCYAKTMAKRLQGIGVKEYERGFEVVYHPHRLDIPRKVKKPTLWFVNSMSDFFHEKVTDVQRDEMMDVMWQTPHHTYQVLTKRPEVMARYFAAESETDFRLLPRNIWWGVSVENRKHGIPRVRALNDIGLSFDRDNMPVFFLSCEPLLEDLGELPLDYISWVIVGGESGARARPMNPEWVKSIRDQCREADMPFFFKQWGAYGEDGKKRGKGANGRLLNGVKYDEMPIVFSGRPL